MHVRTLGGALARSWADSGIRLWYHCGGKCLFFHQLRQMSPGKSHMPIFAGRGRGTSSPFIFYLQCTFLYSIKWRPNVGTSLAPKRQLVFWSVRLDVIKEGSIKMKFFGTFQSITDKAQSRHPYAAATWTRCFTQRATPRSAAAAAPQLSSRDQPLISTLLPLLRLQCDATAIQAWITHHNYPSLAEAWKRRSPLCLQLSCRRAFVNSLDITCSINIQAQQR